MYTGQLHLNIVITSERSERSSNKSDSKKSLLWEEIEKKYHNSKWNR